ncbi:MAG: hypothetical protein K0S24_4748, partial [Sphingobacterium sp.]|nr:hypothetical protein [Sphingobacterium sp.]
ENQHLSQEIPDSSAFFIIFAKIYFNGEYLNKECDLFPVHYQEVVKFTKSLNGKFYSKATC